MASSRKARRIRTALFLLPLVVCVLFVQGCSSSSPKEVSATGTPGQVAGCPAPGVMPAGLAAPPAFLKLPFRERDGRDSLTVTEGWLVSEDEIPFTGDFTHGALDFEFANSKDHGYGLPVLAAADGVAYYSYQYLSKSYTDPSGKTHQIGAGAGLFVEIQHPNGWVTMYIHLSSIAPGIPYVGARPDPNVPGDWAPSGILQPRNALLQQGAAVKQGQTIGYQGVTGIGLDYKDQFDPATGTVVPRDRLALPPWDPTQLHFQLYHGRDGALAKQGIVDVAGVYGRITANANPYNSQPGQFCVVASLTAWVTDGTGQPLYAAP